VKHISFNRRQFMHVAASHATGAALMPSIASGSSEPGEAPSPQPKRGSTPPNLLNEVLKRTWGSQDAGILVP
jgi:hypothetical protein